MKRQPFPYNFICLNFGSSPKPLTFFYFLVIPLLELYLLWKYLSIISSEEFSSKIDKEKMDSLRDYPEQLVIKLYKHYHLLFQHGMSLHNHYQVFGLLHS